MTYSKNRKIFSWPDKTDKRLEPRELSPLDLRPVSSHVGKLDFFLHHQRLNARRFLLVSERCISWRVAPSGLPRARVVAVTIFVRVERLSVRSKGWLAGLTTLRVQILHQKLMELSEIWRNALFFVSLRYLVEKSMTQDVHISTPMNSRSFWWHTFQSESRNKQAWASSVLSIHNDYAWMDSDAMNLHFRNRIQHGLLAKEQITVYPDLIVGTVEWNYFANRSFLRSSRSQVSSMHIYFRYDYM